MNQIAYCTNVHAGTQWTAIRENLQRYACAIRDQLGTNRPLGVGLWFSENAIQEVAERNQATEIRDWLNERSLVPFTFNGFPQSDFHQPVVKHRVYNPNWLSAERLRYTQKLADLLVELLPDGSTGSISTLPIAWGNPRWNEDQLRGAASNFIAMADYLRQLYERCGKKIVLAIEPEPGCVIGDSPSARQFFQRHLFRSERSWVREYLTICHDICHAAVMREDQGRELQAYLDLGIRIGKVQVSSAIEVDWDGLDSEQKLAAFEDLKSFAEDRYLHQTTVRSGPAGSVRLFEDLPDLLKPISDPRELTGSYRVHFHVPIYLKEFRDLTATQSEIGKCLKELNSAAWQAEFLGHWEVETYAWGVLPEKLAVPDLATGIARELAWFEDQLANALSKH